MHTELAICRQFSLPRARHYASELVLGIEALHKMGIIHRDLKPANILIGSDGHLIIADLGLARAFKAQCCDIEKLAYERYIPSDLGAYGDANQVTDTFCGTFEYIAPEVHYHQLYSFAVDIYALGLIMYNMLFGFVRSFPL